LGDCRERNPDCWDVDGDGRVEVLSVGSDAVLRVIGEAGLQGGATGAGLKGLP